MKTRTRPRVQLVGLDEPGLRDPGQTPQCEACLGTGQTTAQLTPEGEEYLATCLACNGRRLCRDCREDGGCGVHGWGEPLDKNELHSALASDLEGLGYTVTAWVRGAAGGVQADDGKMPVPWLVRGVRHSAQGFTLLFQTRTAKRKRELPLAYVLDHRCGRAPCAESPCGCRCESCHAARRAGWR